MDVFVDTRRYGYWVLIEGRQAWVVPSQDRGWEKRVPYEDDGSLIPVAEPITKEVLRYLDVRKIA